MKIYLAAPYSHLNKDIVNIRVNKINKATAYLMNKGLLIYSPISHCHAIAINNNLPTDNEYWEEQNESFIKDWCDQIWILMLEGWKTSLGIQREIIFALQHSKTIDHLYYNNNDNSSSPFLMLSGYRRMDDDIKNS